VNTWSIAGTALIILTSIWVLIDALVLGIKKTDEKSMMNMGAISWFICSLLLWIIVFPLYLVKRQQHLTASRKRAVGNRGLATACASCSASLTVPPELFGEVIECPTCQNQFVAPKPPGMSPYHSAAPTAIAWCMFAVALACLGLSFFFGGVVLTREQLETQVRQNIEQSFRGNVSTMGTEIKSFTLVHEGGNKYKGTLTAQTGKKSETAEVNVTYDGRGIVWKIVPVVATAQADAIAETPKPKKVEMMDDLLPLMECIKGVTPILMRSAEFVQRLQAPNLNVASVVQQQTKDLDSLIESVSGVEAQTEVVRNLKQELIDAFNEKKQHTEQVPEILKTRAKGAFKTWHEAYMGAETKETAALQMMMELGQANIKKRR